MEESVAENPLAPPAGDVGARQLPPLEMHAIAKEWAGAGPVLAGVDVRLDPGAAMAICGHNGTGKTTLLRIACGMIAPDSGAVRVTGIDPERERTAFQRRVGFVSAGNTGLYARLKTEHHLDMWAKLALLPASARSTSIERVTRLFDLAPLCGKRVDRLSMGQRQRLRLALGFLHEPSLVLLDEPTTSLDEHGIALLGAALEELKEGGGGALVCLPSAWEQVPAIDGAMVLAGGRLEPA